MLPGRTSYCQHKKGHKQFQYFSESTVLAPLPAIGDAVVSNDNDALKLYPLDSDCSKPEDAADGSAGIISLNFAETFAIG